LTTDEDEIIFQPSGNGTPYMHKNVHLIGPTTHSVQIAEHCQ